MNRSTPHTASDTPHTASDTPHTASDTPHTASDRHDVFTELDVMRRLGQSAVYSHEVDTLVEAEL